jgi:hypothetical protein
VHLTRCDRGLKLASEIVEKLKVSEWLERICNIIFGTVSAIPLTITSIYGIVKWCTKKTDDDP